MQESDIKEQSSKDKKRAFEINALNDALERANQAKNSKAAQLLPRHLRRRTASHNVKRLPVRLRKKAIEEMESYNTTSKKSSRRKKRKPGSLVNEYMRRQEHPNEKSIRSSYRASEHVTIIHDASYFEWIKLSGDQDTLIMLMNCMTDPTIASVGSERYLGGRRQCSTYLYEYHKYPTHLISPINLLWDHINRNILIWIHPIPPRTNTISKESEKSLQEILTKWPNNVASTDLWNNDLINLLRSTKISDGELNNRRSQLLIPGQKLLRTPNDSVIPILLIQRDGLTEYKKSEYKGGWNLIIPTGWGMDFWKSFIFAGAWVGGLRERHTNHFESGLPCFPYDYPNTKSFINYTSKIIKNELEKEYHKRPPAKRVNYKKFKVDSPFEPAFNNLLSIENNYFENSLKEENIEKGEKDEREAKLIDIEKMVEADNLIEMIEDEEDKMNDDDDKMNEDDKNEDNDKMNEDNDKIKMEQRSWLLLDLTKALIKVRVNLLANGIPKYNAIIYKKLKDLSLASDIIGYVTTGQFSFSQGHGIGIGSCSLTGILDLIKLEKM
ncbi:6280_t:CDS:10 [Diversispora eburnea]|uniref:6280_t:CDS:1 n=1 Tax=Diversispora eburnea TaxID=1213867 RepID=A0A9N8UXK6_9GLOM|nr:6280_t:CDS:10 [Diversispora eburnea]